MYIIVTAHMHTVSYDSWLQTDYNIFPGNDNNKKQIQMEGCEYNNSEDVIRFTKRRHYYCDTIWKWR